MDDLATLEDVAVALGQATVDPTNRKMLNQLHAASGIVRKYTGQDFGFVEDDIVALSGSGTQSMQFPQVPVLLVSDIVEHDYYGGVVNPSSTFLTRLDGAAGLLHRIDDRWWDAYGYLNYTMTYSHGYYLPGVEYAPTALPVEPLPQLVRQQTATIAASLYALDPTGGAVEHEAIGNYEVNYAVATAGGTTAFEPQLRALASYRVVDAA